jgi:hypothetical protein
VRRLALLCFLAACGGAPENDFAEAELALSQAPADAQCLVVRVTGQRKVTALLALSAGQPASALLTGLPLGRVFFDGDAYAVACGQLGGSNQPSWFALPVATTLAEGPPAPVTLTLVH